MKQILTFATVLCLLYSCYPTISTIAKTTYTDSFPGKFKEYLEEGEQEIETTSYTMTSRKANGKYIMRKFLPDSKKMVLYAELSDPEFRTLDGVRKEWHVDGGLQNEVIYVNGQKHGSSKKYANDTVVVVEDETYVEGKLHGTSKLYSSSGFLYYTSEYKNGELDGLSISYDTAMQVERKKHYEKGKLIKTEVLIPDAPGYGIVDKMPTLAEFAHIENDSIRLATSNKALLTYIYKNIKYPGYDRTHSLEGTVFLSYVIDEFGKLQQLRALRSPSSSMAEEAKRVVRLLPDWTPGYSGKKAIRVQYNLPIKFKLQ